MRELTDWAEPKRTGLEWAAEFGDRIHDPDGWRLNDGVKIDTTPITYGDYLRRLAFCTVSLKQETNQAATVAE